MNRVISWLEQRSVLVLAGLVLVGFALRLVAVLALGEDHIHGNESVVVARSLAQGRGFAFDFYKTRVDNPLVSFMPPLYPLVIAFCLRYLENGSLALGLINSGLSTATVILVYLITFRLTERRLVAVLAATVTTFYPVFIVMVASPVSLTLNTFLLTLVVWLALETQQRLNTLRAALLSAVATGVALGLGLLSRPNWIGLLPLILLCLWVFDRRSEKRLADGRPSNRLRLPWAAVAMTAAVFITVLPWLVRTYQVHGQPVFIATNGGATLWNGNNPFTTGSGHEVDTARLAEYLGQPIEPGAPRFKEIQPYPLPPSIQNRLDNIDEVALDRELRQAALAFLKENPGRWLELAVIKLQGFWWFRTNVGEKYEEAWATYYRFLYAAVLLLAVPGLWLSRSHWWRYLLVYGVLAYATVMAVAFHVQTRFRWEVEPYLLILASLTVTHLIDRWQSRQSASTQLAAGESAS